MKKLLIGSVATAMAFCGGVSAKDIEANIALSSEYVFRGISQSDENPAISGGFDYSFDNGIYLGTWASSIDFGDDFDTSTEIDLYAGYAFDLTEGVTLDLSAIYFVYPGETDELNYVEYVASVSFGDAALGVVFSPDYLNAGDSAYVLNADYSFGLTKAVSLDVHAGYINGGDGVAGEANDDDYFEYSLGVSAPFKGLDLSLAFHNTDIDSGSSEDLADERVVFSLSKSF